MKKTGRLHIRVTPELAGDIKAYADRHRVTLSELLDGLFKDLIKNEPAERMKRLGFEDTEGLSCTKK